jgi:chromosome segregation protein
MPSKLKSLELHGYKTFANRTFFGFADTVTAIVGPNGSGKSNIADSMRWVLGEQSYSLLRARKTEDMIFSGSDSRSRAGLASATITFDNSDGWLPIDFSEVAITRRAHRDGSNEYLINGQRIRLKDVNELLAESGLAERTYTVIGQGLVDAALSLRADERRRLFEEAAGIGLHRSRREETLHRLEATQRNLERIQDILVELKPRLSSLERQARRAQEYEQVRADLQVLLREWYGFHWHEAQKNLAEAKQTDQLQETRLEQARYDHQLVEAKLSDLRDRIRTLRNEQNGWHRALSEKHLSREDAIRKLAMVEERKRALETQQNNDKNALDILEEELRFHSEQSTAAQHEVDRLNEELEEARNRSEDAQKNLAERQSERVEAEKGIQSARQELSELNARLGMLQAQLEEVRSQEERANEALEVTQKASKEAESELSKAQERLESAQSNVHNAELESRSIEEELKAHLLKLEQAEASFDERREKFASLGEDLARLKAEQMVLEQAEASLKGYAEGTRLILQAAREARLSGARGALNAFLEVPDHLEKAITAALGDFLDAVVLDADTEPVLDLLERETGQGVLLPLNSLKTPKRQIRIPGKDKQILGIAADLVGSPSELQALIELLLGNVIVVQDRSSAREVLQNQALGVRAVTVNGDLFYASGPIRSGNPESSSQTLLGRGRRLRETRKDEFRIERLAREAEQQMKDYRAIIDKLQSEAKRQELARENARDEFLKSSRNLDQERTNLEQAQRQLDWHREQKQQIQVEQERLQLEKRQISEEQARSEARLAERRTIIRERNAALEAISLDEAQSQVSHWSTRLAVSERALSDAVSRLEDRRQAIERSIRTQAILQERLSGVKASLGELEQSEMEARQVETEVGDQIREINEKIAPAETEIITLEQEQAKAQREADSARQQVSIAEQLHSQTRINLARRQEALQSLQRRIEDDFGLVDYEYVAEVSGPTPLPFMGMVEQLPIVIKLPADIEENIKRQRAQLRRMGPVNPEAHSEYLEVKQRYNFLTEQVADLQKAEQDIRQAISELDELMEREFHKTFEAVAAEFREIFTRLFGGGSARLILTEPNDLTATGIEIEARLPGRRSQGLALLSGGERSLTAVSLVFALLRVSPTPFCVLDEVDAMLDEANVGRFRDLLRELSQQTQFVIVTHNRNTVQVADVLYGVTMGVDSSSQVLSLKLDEIEKVFE